MKKTIIIIFILFICFIVVFIFFGTNIVISLDKQRLYTVQEEINNISEALEKYKEDNGIYPTTEQGINALFNKPLSDPIPLNYREGGYYKGHYLDPWATEYKYKLININKYIIKSFGKDQRLGGDGYNADITNEKTVK